MSAWGGRGVQALLVQVLHEQGLTCHLCLKPVVLGLRARHPRGPSLDHVIPRSRGGTNDRENLRIAHHGCNSRRGAKPLTPELLASFRAGRTSAAGASFF